MSISTGGSAKAGRQRFYDLLGGALKPLLTFISRRRAPQLSGRIYLPALSRPAQVHRDSWGIPHIHAANRHDLYATQGFIHAQDRLWQMELNRRAANGELSALFGRLTLDTDRLSRTLGFARLAQESWQKLDGPTRADLEAYTAGVNAFLDGRPPLPVEFTLLRHRPRRWEPWDSLAYGRLQMWALTNGAMGEVVNAQLHERLGSHPAAQLGVKYREGQPVTLPRGIQRNLLDATGALRPFPGAFLGKGGLDGSGRGSNGWVIAGNRSATGRPILCNDMHLTLSTPSLWHYLHLSSDDGLHVAGFSQPGLPYVLVGHNSHVAWGATLAYTDCEDLFLEEFDPQNPTLYRFRDEWRKAETIRESIVVRGGRDHVEEIRITHHGPIISDVIPGGDQAMALSSTALGAGTTFDGYRLLGEASNWREFVAAVARIEAPALNMLYADTAGNIGYYVSGRVPVRAKGDGTTPAPGWTGEFEWVGEIPFAEMPQALNPQEGVIISANNRIVSDDYPHFLGRIWRSGFRAQRIEQLIAGESRVSLENCRRFQMDLLSLPGRELVAQLSDMRTSDPDAILALRLLRQWDGRLDAQSVGGAVYKMLSTRLAHHILGPLLPPDMLPRYLGQGPHPILAPVNEFQGHWPETLLRLLREDWPDWLPDRAKLIETALAESSRDLQALLGEDPAAWRWGRLHQVQFPHALGAVKPLDCVFNQGRHPIGGDTDTVAQTSMRQEAPFEQIAISISARHIVDLGDLENSWAMYAPGQSGRLGSPYYGNLIQPWLRGEFFPMRWERSVIREACRHRLDLLPADLISSSSPSKEGND